MDKYSLKSDLVFKAENLSEAREILELFFKQITDRKLSDLKHRIMVESKLRGDIELTYEQDLHASRISVGLQAGFNEA